MRKSKPQKSTDRLLRLGIFNTADAIRNGVSQPTISRLTARGEILRLAHGLYQHPLAKIDPSEVDFAIAYKKFGPKSAVGGLSALFRYGLISQVPDRIWVIVPSAVKSTDPLYRCIRTKHSSKVGIENHCFYRMTTIERTLIESLRFATKIGLGIAVSATRKALKERKTTKKKIYEMAKAMKLDKILAEHWESIAEE